MPDGGLSAEQLLKSESPPKPTDFYRSAVRVGILGFFAATAYFFWWLWQLFKLAQREGFPRARAFWWTLVPIYGWVVVYRQLEDLDQRELALGRPGLRPNVPMTLLILQGLAAYVSNQRTANDYLKTKYPDASPHGVTWGEITATGLGLLIFVFEIASVVFPGAFASGG
jgi:hypothetical protein